MSGSVQEAEKYILDFEKHHGQRALDLLCHVALPSFFNAEFLHLVRINFFPQYQLMDEAKVLLSSLCQEYFDGLYKIYPEVRDRLLARLIEKYSLDRAQRIAALLWQYNEKYLPWKDYVRLERLQQLSVMIFFNNSQANEWISKFAKSATGEEKEWFIAVQEKIDFTKKMLFGSQLSDDIQNPQRLAENYLLKSNEPFGEHETIQRIEELDRLKGILCSLPFPDLSDTDSYHYNETFINRQWVLNEVGRWLDDGNASRVLWLLGSPGSGKTVMMNLLSISFKERVAALFHCRYFKVDPRQWVRTLAYQMACRLQNYRRQLTVLDLDNLPDKATDLMETLVIQPMNRIEPPQNGPLIILIDGLDEVDERNGMTHIEALQKLPNWVRLIISSRQIADTKVYPQKLQPYILELNGWENLKDIETYLRIELNNYTADNSELDRVVKTILSNTEGLFLYAKLICEVIRTKKSSFTHLEEFIGGLDWGYKLFFDRQFKSKVGYDKNARPVLEVLVAAKESLEMGFLGELFNWGEYAESRLKRTFGSLITIEGDRVWFIHASFAEWLIDCDLSREYCINTKAGHTCLANYGWMKYGIGIEQLSGYMLKHFATHLHHANKIKELAELLFDLKYIERKYANNLGSDLLAEYNQVLEDERFSQYHKKCREFAAFVRRQRNILMQTPHLTAQLALNEPNNTAPSRAAKKIGNEAKSVTMAFHVKKIQEGHNGTAACCAYISERGWVVSGDADHTLRVWDAETGELVRVLIGHESMIDCCVYIREHDWIVSGSFDKTLRVWDVETGKLVRVLNGPDHISCCTYISGRNWIVSGSSDNTLRVWDASSGKLLRVLNGHTHHISCCTYISERNWIVSGSLDNTLRIWDAESGELIRVLEGHTHYVRCCAYIREHAWIVSGSFDNTLRVWDALSGKKVWVLKGHTNEVRCCFYIRERGWMVSGSTDNILRVWDVASGCLVAELDTPESFFSLTGTLDDSRLFAGGVSGKIYFGEVVRRAAREPQQRKIEIFFSYSHKDKEFCNRLENHLHLMDKEGLIDCWHYQMIRPGEEWATSIMSHLEQAHIILLLVSTNFMESDYAKSEVAIALQRHKQGAAKVIPIILRSVAWHETPLGKLQSLPTNGKPIMEWQDIDEALIVVTQELRKVILQLINK